MWVQQDADYNETALINGSGSVVERYDYDPLGKQTVLDGSWNTRTSSSCGFIPGFQGARLDTTSGLYYERHRDLSASLGRWIQLDPIGYSGSDKDLYRFEIDNPASHLDPSGLKEEHFECTIRIENGLWRVGSIHVMWTGDCQTCTHSDTTTQVTGFFISGSVGGIAIGNGVQATASVTGNQKKRAGNEGCHGYGRHLPRSWYEVSWHKNDPKNPKACPRCVFLIKVLISEITWLIGYGEPDVYWIAVGLPTCLSSAVGRLTGAVTILVCVRDWLCENDSIGTAGLTNLLARLLCDGAASLANSGRRGPMRSQGQCKITSTRK